MIALIIISARFYSFISLARQRFVLSSFLVEAAARMIIFSTSPEISNSSKLSRSNLTIFSRVLDRANMDGQTKDF